MIVSTLSLLSSACFKTALFFSHLKFLVALAMLNVPVVAHHLWYGFIFNQVRPILAWSPI